MPSLDVLMITYDRPQYVRRSLARLLDSCDESMRVWVWHNGTDAETLDTVRSFTSHPRLHRWHHSPDNRRLWAPTNWLWDQAEGDYVSRVDDDCLVDLDWAGRLAKAHEDHERFGVLGSWRFYPEDFVPELAHRKIAEFPGGHRVLQNFWVQGSGYLMKRRCIEAHGVLRPGQTFTQYCVRLALSGWVNGWYYPFVHEEHMDDPRSPHTGLRTDADLQRRLPLSARQQGVTTLGDWERQMRASARTLQAASIDPRDYRGLRRTTRLAAARLRRTLRVAR